MRFKSLLLVVSVLSFGALVGCKSKCESNCADMQDKDCDNFDHDECLHLCISEDDMEQDTDKCTDDFDALMSCISDQSDICKVRETDSDGKLKKCNSEAEDYTKCYTDYCADHDKRDYCM